MIDNYYKFGDERNFKKRADTLGKAERRGEPMLTHGTNDIKMVTAKNAHQQFVNRRPPMNVSDFYSTLKTHDDDHKKLYKKYG